MPGYTDIKPKSCMQDPCLEKFMCRRAQGLKGEFLRQLCAKYVNGLLCVLTNHSYPIFINGLLIPSPSFADDIILLALHPSFLEMFMSICYKYDIKWRYESEHSKRGIVTFGESKPQQVKPMKNCVLLLGDTIADKFYQYKNLNVLKLNHVGSFSSNVEDSIDENRKKLA